MDFDQRVAGLWSNPHNVDMNVPLLYRVDITCEDGTDYCFLGESPNDCELKQHQQQILSIEQGRERGATENYLAVHLALYRAIKRDWKYHCYAVENVDLANSEQILKALGEKLTPNLNGAATWRVADMDQLTIDGLIAG